MVDEILWFNRYPNKRLAILLHCQNRDDISYRGTVSTREEPEE